MFKLQHQFNNIVQTSQTTQLSMSEFHCHCECSKCSSAPTHLQSLNLRSLSHPCRSVLLWQVAPDNLKRSLEFGNCFRICFKLVVSLQHCTPHVIVHWVYIWQIWRPLALCDEIWKVGPQPVLCVAF